MLGWIVITAQCTVAIWNMLVAQDIAYELIISIIIFFVDINDKVNTYYARAIITGMPKQTNRTALDL